MLEKDFPEEGEHNKTIEIAKALKLEGNDSKFIAKITGLTTEEIDSL